MAARSAYGLAFGVLPGKKYEGKHNGKVIENFVPPEREMKFRGF